MIAKNFKSKVISGIVIQSTAATSDFVRKMKLASKTLFNGEPIRIVIPTLGSGNNEIIKLHLAEKTIKKVSNALQKHGVPQQPVIRGKNVELLFTSKYAKLAVRNSDIQEVKKPVIKTATIAKPVKTKLVTNLNWQEDPDVTLAMVKKATNHAILAVKNKGGIFIQYLSSYVMGYLQAVKDIKK